MNTTKYSGISSSSRDVGLCMRKAHNSLPWYVMVAKGDEDTHHGQILKPSHEDSRQGAVQGRESFLAASSFLGVTTSLLAEEVEVAISTMSETKLDRRC